MAARLWELPSRYIGTLCILTKKTPPKNLWVLEIPESAANLARGDLLTSRKVDFAFVEVANRTNACADGHFRLRMTWIHRQIFRKSQSFNQFGGVDLMLRNGRIVNRREISSRHVADGISMSAWPAPFRNLWFDAATYLVSAALVTGENSDSVFPPVIPRNASGRPLSQT
jgi:hypothetical protein